jgi:hypothetical protein
VDRRRPEKSRVLGRTARFRDENQGTMENEMNDRPADWRWLLASPALALILMFWCRLHGQALGTGPVGFEVSAPWALKSTLGWTVAGLLLALYGAQLLESGFATRHRWTARAALVAGVMSITLANEVWLLAGDNPAGLWLYDRLPLHLPFALLLVGGYLVLLARRKPERVARAPTSTMVEVMTGTGRTRVAIDEIECLEADRNYVNVHTPQRSYLLRQTLSSLEKSLCPDVFQRVHRSIIVNRALIRERRHGGVLVLHSGRTVKVSRAFADRLN